MPKNRTMIATVAAWVLVTASPYGSWAHGDPTPQTSPPNVTRPGPGTPQTEPEVSADAADVPPETSSDSVSSGLSSPANDPEPPRSDSVLARLHTALDSDDDYRGARGYVTTQGMTGMFLNPTSGTLRQGQLTGQYCILVANVSGGKDVIGHGVLGAYGVTDYLEVGGFVNFIDIRQANRMPTVAGPFGRVRLVKDEDWKPELSLAGIYLDGGGNGRDFSRTEFVLSSSKRFPIDEEGLVRATRVHAGFRQIWRHKHRSGVDPQGSILYVGGELEFPYQVYFVTEVSNKDDINGTATEHIPYSFGVQWRPNEVVGLSLAMLQDGSLHQLSFYAGVVLSYSF